MDAILGTKKAKERTAMQHFGEGGMILPWTKQILGVLWEHLRLFVEIICYTLIAVFQMFRFEVHLRITDDAEHIQHMTSAAGDPTDSFLLSSLFENNNVSGDPFELNPRSRSVLSSLVKEEICCSLVDDFVSRATECLTENERLYTIDRQSWKHGFDWNVITGSDTGYTDNAAPLTFTACVSNISQNGIDNDGPRLELDCNFSRSSAESVFGRRHQESGAQASDSETSWASTDSSLVDGDKEESDKLWDLLTRSTDPYHPLHFTACVSSAANNQQKAQSGSRGGQNSTYASVAPCANKQRNFGALPLEDDEETLWKSLCLNEDPYHPLNFRAPLNIPAASGTHGQTENHTESSPRCHEKRPDALKASAVAGYRKCFAISKQVVSHKCSHLSVDKPCTLPWKRHMNRTAEATTKGSPIMKRVTFSPVVHVHKMRAWSFALQASRKGLWEEHARDRDRFQRRILEIEQAIGYCFSLSHREKLSVHQQRTISK